MINIFSGQGDGLSGDGGALEQIFGKGEKTKAHLQW